MKYIALLASLFALNVIANASVTETFAHIYPLAPDGAISLENVNGDIEITVWDKAEVAMEAIKRAKDDAALKRIEILIDAQPGRIALKTKIAKNTGWSFSGSNSSSVYYKLNVPAGTRLEKIEAVNSTITVSGALGAITLETVNGGISATDLRANARLESVNGRLHAQFSSLVAVQIVKLTSVNGGSEVTLPKSASATLKTSTVNGRCSVDQPIMLTTTSQHHLAGDIGAGGPRISLETVNGSIAVRER
jgi:DUF4097 and DUF4098 domain-containing protein YvlB